MIISCQEQELIQIPICGEVIDVTIPDTSHSVEEIDEICRNLHKEGYHCGIIYHYVNRINGKGYIGQTTHPLNRHKAHLKNANSKRTSGVWGKVIKRYGIDQFDYRILDIKYNIDEQRLHELLNESEKHYIKMASHFGKRMGL